MAANPVSPKYAITLLVSAQSQPEVLVDLAIRVLEAMSQLVVASRALNTPPGSPPDGICYIAASGSNGDWTGLDNQVLIRTGSAWTAVVPGDGYRAWVTNEQKYVRFSTSGSPSGWIDA